MASLSGDSVILSKDFIIEKKQSFQELYNPNITYNIKKHYYSFTRSTQLRFKLLSCVELY